MTLAPAPSMTFDETLLDRAAALGRRDGLVGHRRDIALEGFVTTALAAQDDAACRILSAALRQCYAAGHRHGADVQRENAARRRRAEAPILSLLPGLGDGQPFRLLPGAPSWAAVQAGAAQVRP
jgi:hypothetical protein